MQLWAFVLLWLGFGSLAGVFPFHTWSPDGHASAPTAVSMLHAGVLMKLGAFGVMRDGHDHPARRRPLLGPGGRRVAVINVIYGRCLGHVAEGPQVHHRLLVGQPHGRGHARRGDADTDGWNGAVYQMFAHGIMTGLFFALVGLIYERAHSREVAKMGGFRHRHARRRAFFTLAACRRWDCRAAPASWPSSWFSPAPGRAATSSGPSPP
jgi:NADH-quinone oxidoreductase subunit M